VHVSAKDRGTNKEQSMTISGGSALPKEDIDRMVRDAEEHAAEDKKRREETEARNTAEQLVYSTEKFLADNGDKVPADSKSEVEAAVSELKDALKDENTSAEDLSAKTTKVNDASQKMGAALYAAQQQSGDDTAAAGAEQPADAGASAPSDDDDVVDAEVVDDEGDDK